MKIVIIDYGMGNLRSVLKAVQRAGCHAIITASPKDIKDADKIILPGVGHFKKGMENLQKLGLISSLSEEVINNKKPILGICLGMQLMMEVSEEGNSDGLGWFEGEVVRFRVANKSKYKVPHMGWNSVTFQKELNINRDFKVEDELYFVHSYHVKMRNKIDVWATTIYDYEFVSAIAKDHIYGFQFHPEKSHSVGLSLMKNFIFN